MDQLKQYYEDSAHRFWDPKDGLIGRDLHIYPLLTGLSGTILEYGCGSGSLLLNLAREERFRRCIGVDLSANALAMVQQAWRELGSGEDDKLQVMIPTDDLLPEVPDGSVDVILSLATIEHVINPYVVLDELHRIASENAVFIGCVPNYAYIKHVFQLMFGIQPRTGTDDPVENWRNVGWDGMHIHTFTKSSFGTLLADCGWKPVKWSGWGQRFRSVGLEGLRRRFPGVWSGEITAVCTKVARTGAPAGKNAPANLSPSAQQRRAARR